jgi:chaperonin GroES
MPLIPIHEKVLIKRKEKEEISLGGIIIPVDITADKPPEGIVANLGTGLIDNKGKLVPFMVEIGDRVLFGRYAGQELTDESDEKFQMMSEEAILGIFKTEPSPLKFGSIALDDGTHFWPISDNVLFKFCSNLTKSTFQPVTTGGIIISDVEEYDENTKDQWVEILALGPKVSDDLRTGKYALVENQKWTHKVLLSGNPYGEYIWKSEEQYILAVSDVYHNPYSF